MNLKISPLEDLVHLRVAKPLLKGYVLVFSSSIVKTVLHSRYNVDFFNCSIKFQIQSLDLIENIYFRLDLQNASCLTCVGK
jgi:hypothetical protein